jgi:hypothetical protein
MVRLKTLIDLYNKEFIGMGKLKEHIDEKVNLTGREFRLF